MNFQEIKDTLESMLKVQRDLQQGQIRTYQQIQEQQKQIEGLIEQGKNQDRRIEQLIGYSISQAGDIIDVQMALRNIYARLSQIEDQINPPEES